MRFVDLPAREGMGSTMQVASGLASAVRSGRFVDLAAHGGRKSTTRLADSFLSGLVPARCRSDGVWWRELDNAVRPGAELSGLRVRGSPATLASHTTPRSA